MLATVPFSSARCQVVSASPPPLPDTMPTKHPPRCCSSRCTSDQAWTKPLDCRVWCSSPTGSPTDLPPRPCALQRDPEARGRDWARLACCNQSSHSTTYPGNAFVHERFWYTSHSALYTGTETGVGDSMVVSPLPSTHPQLASKSPIRMRRTKRVLCHTPQVRAQVGLL